MFNKYYEKTKQFIKENYLTLLFYLVFVAVMTYHLPYYILTGGGTIDTSDRIQIKDEYKVNGSFNFAYVSQLYATIPTYLLAQIMPDWTIESISDYQIKEDETEEELMIRDKLYLEEANTAAIFNAYKKAGKQIEITKENLHIIYLEDKTKTDLQIGDILKEIDNQKITDFENVKEFVQTKDIGDKISLKVERDGKDVSCYAEIFRLNDIKMIGISLLTTYEYELKPELTLKFKNSESGPSGGLTLALTIYNKLTEKDLTGGKKIVGTGTIDMNGRVGSIGGVTYKLEGAVKDKADVFLVPNGENYEDAKKTQKEKSYDIEIIGVDSFDDAIQKLQNLK